MERPENRDDARTAFRRAVEIEPGYSDARRQLESLGDGATAADDGKPGD
jgi:hypothetical protein